MFTARFGRINEGVVRIYLYLLPGGQAAFDNEFNFWFRRKRGFKLGARKFEPAILALSDVPPEYKHIAFQGFEGREGRTIYHVYRSTQEAVILEYSLRWGGNFLRNRLFRFIAQNVKIGPVQPPERAAAKYRAPKMARSERNRGSDRPLTATEQQEVTDAISRAYALLKLNPADADSVRVQDAIYEFINSVLERKERLSRDELMELSVTLGSLWGQTVCDAIGWQWCYATVEGDGLFAVARPNRSHYVPPLRFIHKQLKKRGAPEAVNTSLLTFNLLKAGSLSPAAPKYYIELG